MDNKTVNNEAAPKWYQKHKKALIIGGIAVGTAAAVITYVILKKKMGIAAEIVEVVINSVSAEPTHMNEISDQVIKRAAPTWPVFVSSGLRKLHDGWHASEAQLKLAESLGVIVPEGYTFVKEYTKYNFLSDCA